jgi:nucleotide-binding universal stress UspA family protein
MWRRRFRATVARDTISKIEETPMLRSLLIALDETPAGAAAIEFAVRLAAAHRAAARGVAVVDVGFLTAPEAGRAGAMFYKERRDAARLEEARARDKRLTAAFVERCASAGVVAATGEFEGDPLATLRMAANAHDAIVLGRDSDLHGEAADGCAATVRRLLKETPRPLIVVPAGAQTARRALVAYDGSIPSARALQLFGLLGAAHGLDVHVIAIHPDLATARARAAEAATYLGLHGTPSEAHGIDSKADPADIVAAEIRARDAGLVAMGAYGHEGWRAALLGSFTSKLLATSPAALFVHH